MPQRSSTNGRLSFCFVEPCLPTPAKRAPDGPKWLFELKHDGYRLLQRKDEERVRIFTRRGADWSMRLPRILAAARRLRASSAVIDGEGVVYGAKGMPSFDLLHSHEYDREVSFVAFDLLELNGTDTRRLPLLQRKTRLRKPLTRAPDGIEFNGHLEGGNGPMIFKHVCKLGHEGIVAKRRDLPYASGRSRRWLKIKNPDSLAARRAEDGTF
jgi:bifunctional non-homologous end joining protein LigD